jgi:hypothetical protein
VPFALKYRDDCVEKLKKADDPSPARKRRQKLED